MSFKLVRTVSHFHEDGSESVIEINVIKFDDDREAITVGREGAEDSIMINSQVHLDDLINNLKAVASKVF